MIILQHVCEIINVAKWDEAAAVHSTALPSLYLDFGWSKQIQYKSAPNIRRQDPNNYSDTEMRALSRAAGRIRYSWSLMYCCSSCICIKWNVCVSNWLQNATHRPWNERQLALDPTRTEEQKPNAAFILHCAELQCNKYSHMLRKGSPSCPKNTVGWLNNFGPVGINQFTPQTVHKLGD